MRVDVLRFFRERRVDWMRGVGLEYVVEYAYWILGRWMIDG